MKNVVLAAVAACLLVVGVVQTASAISIISRKAPFTDASADLKWEDLAGFKFEKATVQIDEVGGYTVDYTTPFEGRLSVSVYSLQGVEVAEGAASLEIKNEIERIHDELDRGVSEDGNGSVEKLTTIDIGNVQGDAFQPRYRRTISVARRSGEEVVVDVVVTGHRGFVVSIRAAYSTSATAQAQAELERFFVEVDKMIQS